MSHPEVNACEGSFAMAKIEQSDRRQRPGQHRLQPVDPVRGVPALHGGREGSASSTTRRSNGPLDRRRRGDLDGRDHRAGARPAHRLALDLRAAERRRRSRSTASTMTRPGSRSRWSGSQRASCRTPATRSASTIGTIKGDLEALQGVHRGARQRDRRVARRDHREEAGYRS